MLGRQVSLIPGRSSINESHPSHRCRNYAATLRLAEAATSSDFAVERPFQPQNQVSGGDCTDCEQLPMQQEQRLKK